MNTVPILYLSLALQSAAAVLAVRLIRKTSGTGHAWLLLAGAMVLMTVRRGVTLVGIYVPDVEKSIRGPIAETIALAIAALVLASVLRIPRVFEALQSARAAAEAAKRRSHFLAEATGLLASSLEYEGTIGALAHLAVPMLGDLCLIDLVVKGRVVRVSVAHADLPEGFVERLRLGPLHPPDLESQHPIARALRSGRPQVDTALPDELLHGGAGGPALRRGDSAATNVFISVPIVIRGGTIGALTFAVMRPGRGYGPDETALAEELSRRAAIAADNSRLYREAQEAIRQRDEFLSIASHELYTPITALQLALQRVPRLVERVVPFLETAGPGETARSAETLARSTAMAQRQTARLAQLIEELLDVTRIRAGRLHLDRTQFDLCDLVRDVATRFRPQLAQAGCTLSLALATDDSGVGCVGTWDRSRVDQVVTNLLSNAMKFGAGRPIDLRVEPAGDAARLVVTDQGIGIAPERQAQIFGQFERAVSREYVGLGMGLYIVRQIVEAHGGSIRVRSSPGGGSAFTVELPYAGPARA